jgi:hypothetical protein
MRSGRPLSPLTVSAKQWEQIQVWSRHGKNARSLALRSRIVLLAAVGCPTRKSRANSDVSCRQPVSGAIVYRLRCDLLLYEPRSGTRRDHGGEGPRFLVPSLALVLNLFRLPNSLGVLSSRNA